MSIFPSTELAFGTLKSLRPCDELDVISFLLMRYDALASSLNSLFS